MELALRGQHARRCHLSISFLCIGYLLLYLQYATAGLDEHANVRQVALSDRPQDWAATRHGGFILDFALVPLGAWIQGQYGFSWFSVGSAAVLTLAGGVSGCLIEMWRRMSVDVGDHMTHGGWTTPAGMIHGVFMTLGIWLVALVYLGWTDKPLPQNALVIVSSCLAFFIPISVMKFSSPGHVWRWDAGSIGQVVGLETLLGVVTAYRLGII